MFSLRLLLLVSMALLCVVGRDTGTTSEELMPQITSRLVKEQSWWENGSHVHKYTIHFSNRNGECVDRLGFDLKGGSIRDMWGIERYQKEGNNFFRTPQWLKVNGHSSNNAAGFIGVGNVRIELDTLSAC